MMTTITLDLSRQSLTAVLDLFRTRLAEDIARLAADEGITLRPEVVAQVLTTLDVLSTATHAQGA